MFTYDKASHWNPVETTQFSMVQAAGVGCSDWLLLLQPSCVSSLFLTEIKRLVSPDPTLAADCPGQCRLRPMCYMVGGEADSDCGGFMQVS